MKRKLLTLTLLILTSIDAFAQLDPVYAVDVLYPNGKNTQRFEGKVTLAIAGNTGGREKYLKETISQFNEICSGLPTQVEVIGDVNSANIVFNINPNGNNVSFESQGSQGKLKKVIVTNNYNPTSIISEGVGASGVRLGFRMALLRAIGFSGYGNKFSEVNQPPKDTMDNPLGFTISDKQLIRFAYEKVPANTPPWKVKQLVKKEFAAKPAKEEISPFGRR